MIGTKVIYYFGLTKQFLNIFISMERKKAYQKYVDKLNADRELQDVYRDLRQAFKREGWTEEDLVKPPYYPTDIMKNFQNFSELRDKLYHELKTYFDIIDHNEFSDYISSRLKQIDLETPLENGNIKRNNQRDENY
jgi:hypothetical protein